MADELSDFDRAHIEYLRQRMAEIEAESRQAFQDLGEQLGVENLTPADVTLQQVERMMLALAEQIRHWGNTALADRYQSAFTASWRAMQEQGRFLRLRLERTLTDVEEAQAGAADAAADEVSEHFERVQAEASAYFKGLDEKGGV